MISRLAIESLPAAVPAFLRTSRAAALVGELAREPDRSKGAGDSHDHDRETDEYKAGFLPYALEKAGAFSVNPAAGRNFAADRLAAAVSELRDMIVMAWRTSVDSTVGYPPVPVRDVESGKVNPIAQMRGLD